MSDSSVSTEKFTDDAGRPFMFYTEVCSGCDEEWGHCTCKDVPPLLEFDAYAARVCYHELGNAAKREDAFVKIGKLFHELTEAEGDFDEVQAKDFYRSLNLKGAEDSFIACCKNYFDEAKAQGEFGKVV